MEKFLKEQEINSKEVVNLSQESNNAPYLSPTPGVFPIIAVDFLPEVVRETLGADINKQKLNLMGEDELSEFHEHYDPMFNELCDYVVGAGFNAIMQNNDLVYAIPKICKQKGIKIIGLDDGFSKNFKTSSELLESDIVMNDMAALQIKDEPKYYQWGDVFFNTQKYPAASVERWDSLTFGYSMARCYRPDKLTLFNLAVPDRKNVEELDGEPLLPGERPVGDWPQNDTMGSCATYTEYLDVLQRLFKPGVWSYDVYPFKFSKIEYFDDEEIIPSAENCIIRYDHFYESLQLFYNQSIKTGRPFWAYCMSVEHEATKDGKPEWAMPAPTVPMLKFEAFSAIACGAQGILYWKFGGNDGGRPAKDSTYIKSYAPVVVESYTADGENNWDKYDFKLKNTKIWYAAKEVNAEIHKYEDIFLGAKIVACGHTDNSLIHADKFTFQYGCIESIAVTASNSPNVEEKYFGNGVLVSVVTTKALKHYMVIVSKRPFENTPLQIVFKKGYKGIFVNSQQDINSSHNADGKFVVSYDLAPGDWIIIESARDK